MADDLSLEWHLVAFLDVVGQREKLLQLWMPKTPQEYLAVQEILKQTVGVVLPLRETFQKEFDGFERGFLERHPELKKGDCAPNFLPFSDAFVTWLTFRRENGSELLTAIRLISALAAACWVMLVVFASKHALRGGIDMGPGVRLPKTGEPYGRALVTAYKLESEVAQFPRIMIGDELWSYLSLGVVETNGLPAPIRALMKVATELTAVDTDDGKRILDYLGPGLAKLVPVDNARDLVNRAYQGVVWQQEYWRSKGKIDRSERYSNTRKYFDSHLSIWGLSPT
jgi:hypothetical protein